MTAGGGPARRGTALFVSPGRVLRGLAFAPAVRGYPGGIADMAGDLGEDVTDLSSGDDDLWEPTEVAEPGDPAAGPEDTLSPAGPVPAQAGAPVPGQQVPGQQVPGQQVPGGAASGRSPQPVPAAPVSVWQQAAAAWQEAGIDWMRPAAAGARPAGQPAADEDPHTEPIPVLTADGTPRAPRAGDSARGSRAEHSGAERLRAERPAVATGSAASGAVGAAAGAPGTAEAGRAEAGTAIGEGPGAAGPASGAAVAGAWTGAGGAGAEGGAAAGATSQGLTAGEAGPAPGTGASGTGTATGAAPGGIRPARRGKAARGGTRLAARGKAAPGGTRRAARGKAASGASGTGTATGAALGGTRPAARDKAAPGGTGPVAADQGTPAGRPKTGGPKTGRKPRVTIVAVLALVLIAGTLAGLGIARSGGIPAKPQLTLVTPYPAAVAADATLADRTGGTAPLLASLTGIASAGKTVVAIGAAPSQPAPVPLLLVSADGGHTWARATVSGAGTGPGPGAAAGPGLAAGAGAVAGPGGAAPPAPVTSAITATGTVPVLIARGGGGTWLALGQHAAWTSPDGKTWQPAPGLPPVAGDTVLGLAGTGSGFVAVGEHTGGQPGPVVWTSSAGRSWLRWTGTARGLAAHGGQVTALRWAAAQGGVVVAGGPIAGAPGAGRRPDAGVWRSTDGGLHWTRVTLPASHGATDGLAGLAANGTTFVAVRPGRAAGHQDAVTYLSGQGSTWRYAGKLTPVRRTSLQVTLVSGSSHGFVVGALVHASRVAFFSARGHGWQRTADPGTGVTGLTAGSGGTVLAAGDSRPGPGGAGLRPHLMLIGPGPGRQQVGQAVLAAAATPDVTVNGLAPDGRTLVAAGAAGGSPALWLALAGQWARAGVLLPAAWRDGELLSVAHGGAGWLAVGQAGSPARSAPAPAPARPVILTSATGTSWAPAPGTAPLTAPGTSLVQAAAGPAGYVVVGSVLAAGGPVRGMPVPAAWYSAGLGSWARAPLPSPGAGPGAPGGSSQVDAVTAARSGFVAVGAAGRRPAVWTSRSGSAWRFVALPRPAGAAAAVLTKVTAQGRRVMAAGYELRSGPAPTGGSLFTAVSADGGRTWHESALPAPPGPAAVTALTAAGRGFAAVGRDGPPGRQRMLAWWSSTGLTWNDAEPAAGGPGRPFVMQINALTAAGGTLTGAGFAVSATVEHPVLWHARYR